MGRARVSSESRPLVTLVIPGYNEAAVLAANVALIYDYLETLAAEYRFEVFVVNDGSADMTGTVADELRSLYTNLRVLHHPSNFGLGQAFKTAFSASRGDYVVTLDVDLSYAPQTIGDLLTAICRERAKLVLASAYMKGGRTTMVPWLRLWLSRVGNGFISLLTGNQFSTFTCMVRAYDGPFIRSLNPTKQDMAIMPEIIYKTMILGGKIVEIPAHLDWTRQVQDGCGRTSNMRVLKHILSTSISAFFFRPFVMMLVPGLLLLLFSGYVNLWVMVEFQSALPKVGGHLSQAAAQVFAQHPATLLIGLLSLVLAVQLISLGAISLQAKRYYEESYCQQVSLRRQISQAMRPDSPGSRPGESPLAGSARLRRKHLLRRLTRGSDLLQKAPSDRTLIHDADA